MEAQQFFYARNTCNNICNKPLISEEISFKNTFISAAKLRFMLTFDAKGQKIEKNFEFLMSW